MLKSNLISNRRLFYLFLQLLLLLTVGAFLIYKLKSPISNFLFYTYVFYSFIASKKVVFWASALFIIVNSPWALFYYVPYEWYFNLTPTVGISFVSIVGIILLIKALYQSKWKGNLLIDNLKSFYYPIGFFIMFLLLWSFAFGNDVISVFNIIQYLPALIIFYILPRLLKNEELLNFNKLIFLFSLVHFSGSLIEIVRPGSFLPIIYFGPPEGIEYGDNLIRFVGGITIHLYTMFIGLYYLSKRVVPYKKWYLWLVIIISYIFILNSATRGWMIASTFLLSGYFLYSFIRERVTFISFARLCIILIVLVTILPGSFKTNIFAAYDRLETVEAITEGDFSARGTLSRLTERGPHVLTKFSESPVFGFGYSKITAKYFDGHVGNHSLLLMGGVVGLAIIWGTILSLVWYFFRKDIQYPNHGFFVFGLALLTIMIIHSSSRSMVSYYMPADAAFLIGLIFNHFNSDFNLIKQAKWNKNETGIK